MNISKWNKMFQLKIAAQAGALKHFLRNYFMEQKKLKCKCETFPNSALLFAFHADHP